MNPRFEPILNEAMSHLEGHIREAFRPMAIRRIETMEEQGVSEEKILAVLNRLVEKYKSRPGSEADAWKIGQKIYADFLWELRKSSQTYSSISGHLAHAIERCMKEVRNPSVREQMIEQYRKMEARISEWTVENKIEVAREERLCATCGHEFGEYEHGFPVDVNGVHGFQCTDCKIKGK